MDIVKFSDGLHPHTDDLNALGTFTEASFDALLRALSTSDNGQLLFDMLSPTVTLGGSVDDPELEISSPAQRFAVAGAVQVAPASSTVRTASTDLWVAVYLVAGKIPENQPRDFTSVDPTTGLIVQQQLTTEIYRRDDPETSFSVSTDLLTAPEEPVMSSLTVGQVKLADVKFTESTGGVAITLNAAAQYMLPAGAAGGLASHVASHLPGGSDPLPESIVTGTASSVGLMPADALYKVDQSLQSLAPAVGSEYLTVTTDSDRASTIAVKLADSLDVVDDGGITKLGVNHLPKSSVAGFEDRSARSDHQHPAIAAGIIVQVSTLDVSTTLNSATTISFAPQNLGSLTINPGRIVSVQLYWLADDQVDPTSPRGVECGWQMIWESGANRSVGARSYILNADTFQVEVGEVGATTLTNSALSAVQSGAWTSPAYNGGQFPTTGKIQIVATAVSA